MENTFFARTENVGNVYRDIETERTYVMVQSDYSEYAMVSILGIGRWQGPTERGEVFVHEIDGEVILEYIGRIDSVNIKRETIQIEEVRK